MADLVAPTRRVDRSGSEWTVRSGGAQGGAAAAGGSAGAECAGWQLQHRQAFAGVAGSGAAVGGGAQAGPLRHGLLSACRRGGVGAQGQEHEQSCNRHQSDRIPTGHRFPPHSSKLRSSRRETCLGRDLRPGSFGPLRAPPGGDRGRRAARAAAAGARPGEWVNDCLLRFRGGG